MAHNRLRFGILSTAQIGGRLVKALAASEQAELVAIASRDAGRIDAYAAKHGVADEVRRLGSYEALLADDGVDAIYNPLPNALHAEWTVRALAAGKHVLCEKPLAVDVAECQAMIEAAEQAGRVLMEAFMYRHHPQTQRIAELVADGAVGEVRVVRSGFCFTVNDPANIRLSRELHGGATMDVGCYCVNFARMLCGEPATAYALAQFGEESGVDETLCGTLSFDSGAVAQFECSVKSAGRVFADVLGSTGTLSIPRPWSPDPERATFLLNGQEQVVEQGGDSFAHELSVFCCSVLTGEPLPLPPLDGARNMAAVVALLQSARTGEVVAVEGVGG